MTTITANEAMLACLSQAEELAEIRDATGKVVGFYAPVAYKNALHSLNADASNLERNGPERTVPGFTPEEIQRIRKQSKDDWKLFDPAELKRRLEVHDPSKAVEFSVVVARLKELEAEFNRRNAAGEKELTREEALAYWESPKQTNLQTQG